jgi:hypothetical protein
VKDFVGEMRERLWRGGRERDGNHSHYLRVFSVVMEGNTYE